MYEIVPANSINVVEVLSAEGDATVLKFILEGDDDILGERCTDGKRKLLADAVHGRCKP